MPPTVVDTLHVVHYRHTQTTYLAPAIVLVVLVVMGVLLLTTGEEAVAALFVAVFLVVLAVVTFVFSRLTVVVDDDGVTAAFGRGWPKRRYTYDEIDAIRPVRNKWYYGWGIRWIPGGWMYNVWGLDAVELELSSGKVFRVGTDEPDALHAALVSSHR